jgi:hypothetical protein
MNPCPYMGQLTPAQSVSAGHLFDAKSGLRRKIPTRLGPFSDWPTASPRKSRFADDRLLVRGDFAPSKK